MNTMLPPSRPLTPPMEPDGLGAARGIAYGCALVLAWVAVCAVLWRVGRLLGVW